eukprot:gene12605-16802_t
MAAQGWDLLVLRSDLHQTKIAPVTLVDPAEGEVLFRVESFALTANNVTYAVAGDQIGYWRFFPKADGWGCIPAWGYGVVEASAHPDFTAGERFYGYWPMGSHLLAEWQMPVEISIMLFVISGTTLPGSGHVLGVGRQVVVVGVDQLQLQLDAQRQRLGMGE